MTQVTGPLTVVTERSADVVEVWIRAPEPRPHNDGLIIDTTDRIEVTDGQLSFPCAPGPAILIVVTLVATGRLPSSQVPETRAVPILVPAAESVTLADVVNAATVSTLGQSLVEELAVRVANDLAAAEAAAERAEAAAQSAETGVQPDTVGRVHLTPALRGELDEKVTAEHEHSINEVYGLDTALAGKSDTGHRHSWDQVDGKPETFPPTTGTTPDTAAPGDHTHTAAEVGAAPADHSHPEYATTEQVNARTPEIRMVSSKGLATAPGVLYVVREG